MLRFELLFVFCVGSVVWVEWVTSRGGPGLSTYHCGLRGAAELLSCYQSDNLDDDAYVDSYLPTPGISPGVGNHWGWGWLGVLGFCWCFLFRIIKVFLFWLVTFRSGMWCFVA